MTKLKKKIVIAVDPGRVNWAYCILTPEGKVLRQGLWRKTIDQLKEQEAFNKDLEKFRKMVSKFFENFESYSYVIVYERMVPRSFNMKGNTAEIVNMCIGLFLSKARHKKLVCLTAATWKNFCKKHNLLIKNKTLPEHISDAMRMGLYYLLQKSKIDLATAKSIVKYYNKNDFGWKFTKKVWRKEEC